METRNGYAQLSVRNGNTYVTIYPPQEHGKPIDFNELTEYLGRNLLDGFEPGQLRQACRALQPTEVVVGRAPFRPYNETMYIRVSQDNMLVFCRFYPASEGGEQLSVNDIVQELMNNKVTVGIDRTAITAFTEKRVYNTEFIFAKGIPPRHGKDGRIEYFFNTSLNTRPKKNEDGTVDYHNLNTVSIVKKGEKLAKLHAPDPGEPGQDVFGKEIKPKNVKTMILEFGNNISTSEDRTEMFSDVTGHAKLVNGKVFVSDILEIPADVDTSTGDINYSGSVMIRGNVKSGFKVKAQGDIIVEGVVEGAELETTGQIIIKRGIHGMSKGILKADGNIICKFIENAEVISGGYVETESILHSQVSAYSTIHVSGRKGFITGGLLRAGKVIEAQIVGSEMGTLTRIEVGIEPAVKSRFLELQKYLVEQRKTEDKLRPILVNYTEKHNAGVEFTEEQMEYIKKVADNFKQLKASITEKRKEYEKLHEQIMMADGARVKVSNIIYPGVQIAIGDVSMTTKDSRRFCQFVKQGADVTVLNL